VETANQAAFYAIPGATVIPLAEILLEHHSGELTILVLFVIVILTLIILVPQLLRAHLHKVEMQHQEHMRALEQGYPIPPVDEPSRLAGRTAMLVPMAVMITAGTVTCFIAAYKPEDVLGVTLAVWTVGGVVSLAAITGGVALLGRLAQLHEAEEEHPAAEKHEGR
jgi:hypothetical protein